MIKNIEMKNELVYKLDGSIVLTVNGNDTIFYSTGEVVNYLKENKIDVDHDCIITEENPIPEWKFIWWDTKKYLWLGLFAGLIHALICTGDLGALAIFAPLIFIVSLFCFGR